MAFVDEFDDMMGSLVTAQNGTLGDSGDWVASGSSQAIPCYIEGKAHLVRDAYGREVTSMFMVVTNSWNNLNIETYRFTLPSVYSPRTELEAIAIEPVEDETGPIYEVIHL